MRAHLARVLSIAFVSGMLLVSPATSTAAAGPIETEGPDLATLVAHYRAVGLPAVADRLLTGTRVTVPARPAPAGIRWGIVNITSQNWAGYVADVTGTGRTVSEVRGYFTVSQAGDNGHNVGTWTGIGGFRGTNLWQTGIDQSIMFAWTEAYPATPQYWFGVYPNDLMFSNVFSNGNGTYTAIIQDYTTGLYRTGTFGCCPNTATAEWITEGHGSPIPYFNQFQTTYDYWFYSGGPAAQNVDSAAASTTWRVTMSLGGSQCITPGGLGADHHSYWMYWGC